MAARYEAIIRPFDLTARLLASSTGQLVPFRIGSVRDQLSAGAILPALDHQVPGLGDILSAIPGASGPLGDVADILKNFGTLNLSGLLEDLFRLIPDTANFLSQQLWVGMALFSIVSNAAEAQRNNVGQAVATAYQNYFFSENGYLTLEGGTIAPPSADSITDYSHVTLAQVRAELRSYASRRTADNYVRDLIRVTVEASGNALFALDGRYQKLLALTDDKAKIKQAWFKGFSTLAESTVTSAVEQAALGISTFSTNPIIAAALGTFAGSAARKATQLVFLEEIGL